MTVVSLERKTRLEFDSSESLEEALQCLAKLVKSNQTSKIDSYSPERPNQLARWFIGGRDYFSYLTSVLARAKHQIFITDWFISPFVMLRRDFSKNSPETFQLNNVLLKKAEQGVKIYIQIYAAIDSVVPNAATDATKYFNELHENIQCVKHATGVEDLLSWSHHEKLVIVDQSVAFVGGIDLCAGRYDDETFPLYDQKTPYTWPGKDYQNTFQFDNGTPETTNWFKDGQENVRHNFPRCPWEDIAGVVYGKTAYDVAVHFCQRWNWAVTQEAGHYRSTFEHLAARDDLIPRDSSFYDTTETKFKKYENGRFLSEMQTCSVQAVRSSGNWSLGLEHKEKSIQEAYIEMIGQAKHFVFIENQFFVTYTGKNEFDVKNRIGLALCDAIIKHHRNGSNFKVYICIPHVPEFIFDGLDCREGQYEAKNIMHRQYWSIDRGENSMFNYMKKNGVLRPEDYIFFCCLRKVERQPDNGKLWGQTIYVHSKLMIVDDQQTIFGSANINDRSMCGDRDSEFAVKIRDEILKKSESKQVYPVGDFARQLRLRLFSKLENIYLKRFELDDIIF